MHHLVFAGILVAPIAAAAQVPTIVNFEAVISDTTGEPVAGATTIDVELFDAAASGTSLGSVFGATVELDADGYFAVPLSFAGVDISGGQLFLELVVDGETIVPRFEIGSVPYALATGPLAEGSVGSSQIAADAVDASHIASSAVGSSEIAAGAVDASHIASNAVGSSEIAAGAVGSSEIAPDAVDASHIASSAVGSSEIAAGAVGSSEIAAGAVGSSEIATGAVDASHIASGFGLVPAGTIVMWSGTLASIPAGWGLCDGSQGTPDLRDRFILSVDAGEDPGATGGTHGVTLGLTNLPSHAHTFTTDSAGSHSHAINPPITGMDNTEPNDFDFQLSPAAAGGHLGALSGTQAAGNHAHSGTTDAAGGGQAFDNRPAFYELAFIMKLP